MYYNTQFDVAVIGGGASGMMAAGVAASLGKSVIILEKNKSLGEKLKITGGGRCNITNHELDLHTLLEHYGKAKDFLFSPFSQFGIADTFDFFQSRGLPLVTQARNRVFPETEKAWDVFKVLEKDLHKYNVTIKTGVKVTKINQDKGTVKSVETNQGSFEAKSYIISTGGISHPETGSTGDGFSWLESLGHTVKTPTPTIVPLAVEENWVKVLAGVALTFMKITFYLDGKKQFSKTGKVLFTHFGLSGPLILNSASEVHDLLLIGDVTATIDAFPDTDLGSLDERTIKILNGQKNKLFKTVFKELVPQGTVNGIEMLLAQDIDFEKPVHSITREERKKIVHLLKSLPITITGLMGTDRAVAADGGVILEEIDMRSMRSNKFNNLYLTGDVLNINRPSGGYSLQLCWTSGFVAGKNA